MLGHQGVRYPLGSATKRRIVRCSPGRYAFGGVLHRFGAVSARSRRASAPPVPPRRSRPAAGSVDLLFQLGGLFPA
jgi:hypothetical protein